MNNGHEAANLHFEESANSQQIIEFLAHSFSVLHQLDDSAPTVLSSGLQGLPSFDQYDSCDVVGASYPGQYGSPVNAITFSFRHSMLIAGDEHVSFRDIILQQEDDLGFCIDEYDNYNRDEFNRHQAEEERHSEFTGPDEKHADMVELIHRMVEAQKECDNFENMFDKLNFVTVDELAQLTKLLNHLLQSQ